VRLLRRCGQPYLPGGTLARAAWAGFLEAAEEIANEGTFSRFEGLPDVDALLTTR